MHACAIAGSTCGGALSDAVRGEHHLQDLVNLLLKVHVQEPVRLVKDKVLERLQGEALRSSANTCQASSCVYTTCNPHHLTVAQFLH